MTIECRLAAIEAVKLDVVSDASIVQFGDSLEADLSDRAIALQRRYANFTRDETRFASYPIFALPLPQFPEQEDGILVSRSQGNTIQVGTIRLISLDASSYLHAGCMERLTTESRIKHIRQFDDAALQPRIAETL